MSHREHAPGVAERGNDWLDGALAGWLLFIAINGGSLAWHSLREGAAWSTSALNLAVPVLAVAAIFPLLRFHRIGWGVALVALGLMAAREGMMLAASEGAWRATAAFLVVDLLGVAYLLWIIPEFWPRHPEPESVAASRPAAPAVVEGAESASSSPSEPSAAADESAAPAEPTPVMHALAAIHHRMVAAGSACAVTEVAVRAEAGRFGVTPAALRTEGLSLYRTFLRHFMADGALSADEERELICLERALDLDDDGVWKLRAEAGLVGGMAAAAPPLLRAPEPSLPTSRPALSTSAPVDADRLVSVDADRAVSVDGDRLVPVDDSVDDDRLVSADDDRPASVDAAPDDDPPADVEGPPVAAGTEPEIDAPPMPLAGPAIRTDGPVRMGTGAAEPDPSAQAHITSSVPRLQSPGLEAGDAASPVHQIPAEPAPFAEPDLAMGGVPELRIEPSPVESAAPDVRIDPEPIESAEPELRIEPSPVESAAPDVCVDPQPIESAAPPAVSASAGDPDALEDYEAHELRAALAWAGIGALPAGAPRRTALERLRALYRAATEPLEPCATDVALEPGESCLAQRDVQVYVAAAGAAPPPDLPGPVLPRRALVDGSLDRDRDLDALQRRGACRFVLTERRLLLVTPSGQRSELAVSRVRAVHPHRNGIEVRQQRGAPVFLAFSDGVGDAAMRMDRAAADLRARAG